MIQRRLLWIPGLTLAIIAPAGAADVSRDTGQVMTRAGNGALIHRLPDAGFKPSEAYQWLETLLEASGRDAVRNQPRPTVLSRTMAIVLTAMYDAWAAYDNSAVGTRLNNSLRRPAKERTRSLRADSCESPRQRRNCKAFSSNRPVAEPWEHFTSSARISSCGRELTLASRDNRMFLFD